MGLSLTISESNVDKSANTSKITATLKISSSASWNYDSRSGYIQIDGTKYSFSHSFSTGTTTLATKSKTVTHDDDGGGKITVKGYYSTGVSLGNLSVSKSYTLTTIDRTYTIKFNANTTDSVSNMPSSQTKTYGKTLTLSTKVPTRTGYTFKEWNTSSKGTGTSYSPGGSYKTNAADTLYAIWTENSYAITYTLPSGYGTFSSNSSTSLTVTAKYSEASLVPGVTPATGYKFLGFVVNGTTYQPGYIIKAANATTSITSVAATSSNFEQLTVTIKFYSDSAFSSEYTALRMTQSYGTSFLIPEYPESLSATQEFKYWLDSNNYYVLPNKSYTLRTDNEYYAVISTKAARTFKYFIPSSIETSSQIYSLYASNSASIGQSYTLLTSTPGTKTETGIYTFAYWTTTIQQFDGADYANVIPQALKSTVEADFTDHYSSTYDLYESGWTIDSVSDDDSRVFYAVYIDNTPSEIEYTGHNYAYYSNSSSSISTIQANYANYILIEGTEDTDIVLHNNTFVSYIKLTLPSNSVSVDLSSISITGSNSGDAIDTDSGAYILTTRFIGLDYYIFFSGTIAANAEVSETTTITISGLQDSLEKTIGTISFTISPPKIIRDVSDSGNRVSYFNQNKTVLSDYENEFQLTSALRAFDPNSTEFLTVANSYDTTYYPYLTLGSRTSSSAIGKYSVAMGENIVASGDYSLAFGTNHTSESDVTYYTIASNDGAIALGRGDTASNTDSIAIGYGNTSSGNSSTAIGCIANATGGHSTAIGYYVTASATCSNSFGYYAIASGGYSTAVGTGSASLPTQATATYSTAIGYNSTASGYSSLSIGIGTIAASSQQTVLGKYNISDSAGSYVFIVGDGTGTAARSNALTIDNSGNLETRGYILAGGDIGSSGDAVIAGDMGVAGNAEITGNAEIIGNVYIGGHTTYIGWYYTTNVSSQSTSADTWKTLIDYAVPDGVYVVTVTVNATVASGKRIGARLYDSTSDTTYSSIRNVIGSTGSNVVASAAGVVAITDGVTHTLCTQAYTGAAVSSGVSAYFRIVRIA